jgi:hypothetical protein
MQFRVDQRFAAAADVVLAMYLDQSFYGSLAGMEKIGPPDVVSLTRDDDAQRAHLRLRYAFVGDLPRAALAVLDPRKLTWIEDTDVDLAARSALVQLKPDNYADRLTASAHWVIEPDGDDRSTRRVDGSVEVRMPFVGGQVEKAIISGLREHLVAEQDRAADWLRHPT